MPVIELTNDQARDLLRQLPVSQQSALISEMNANIRRRWDEYREHGEQAMRRFCAERGLDFDAMTDDERLDFVNELVHEDRE